MRHSFFAAGVVALLALPPAAVAASATTNPADLDREIVRQMSQGPDDPLQADDVDAVPLDATLKAYLDRRRPVLDLMHRAAAMPHADWGPIDADITKALDSLNGARAAVMVTWLAARADAHGGRPADAVTALLDGFALARHVGQRPLLVCHLVEIGCEHGSVERLAALLPTLPKDVAAGLPARLDALPPHAGFAAVIEGERQFGRLAINRQMADPTTPPAGLTRTAAVSPFETAMMDGVTPLYDAMKAAAGGTPDAFEKAVNAAAAKLSLNPMAGVLAPGFARSREGSAKTEAEFAMLRTAAVIAATGPAALALSKDPFGDGPFVRTDTADGYTLRGKLVDREGPVTLRVGR